MLGIRDPSIDQICVIEMVIEISLKAVLIDVT